MVSFHTTKFSNLFLLNETFPVRLFEAHSGLCTVEANLFDSK